MRFPAGLAPWVRAAARAAAAAAATAAGVPLPSTQSPALRSPNLRRRCDTSTPAAAAAHAHAHYALAHAHHVPMQRHMHMHWLACALVLSDQRGLACLARLDTPRMAEPGGKHSEQSRPQRAANPAGGAPHSEPLVTRGAHTTCPPLMGAIHALPGSPSTLWEHGLVHKVGCTQPCCSLAHPARNRTVLGSLAPHRAAEGARRQAPGAHER